jgi:pantetheine-phosphate adenylyltransferase
MASTAEAPREDVVGIFPASFDPIHNGHVSIVERAAPAVDKLVLVVAVNPAKAGKYMFDTDEKIELARASTERLGEKIDVVAYDRGLTVVEARRDFRANFMFRGMRSVTDFEVERELAQQNLYVQRALGIEPGDPEYVETLSLYNLPEHDVISSSMARFFASAEGVDERAALIEPMVPGPVFEALMERITGAEAPQPPVLEAPHPQA